MDHAMHVICIHGSRDDGSWVSVMGAGPLFPALGLFHFSFWKSPLQNHS
jgi:hypothetical protein